MQLTLEGIWETRIFALSAAVGVGYGIHTARRSEVAIPPPRYPSDLSDEEWTILEPLLGRAEERGRPPKWPTPRVADGVFYLLMSGCSWRMLPREYPP